MPTELTKARELVKAIKDAGFKMVVWSEGERVNESQNDIVESIFAVNECDLCFYTRDSEGKVKRAGTFYIVLGNAYDGCELVADHSDNEFCNKLWDEIFWKPYQ